MEENLMGLNVRKISDKLFWNRHKVKERMLEQGKKFLF